MEVKFSNVHIKGASYSATNPRIIAHEKKQTEYYLEVGGEDFVS